MARRATDLSRPRRRLEWSGVYDPDAFGRFSETVARFLGTGRFLVGQTIVVTGWIIVNVFVVALRWDPYPFILLNLLFSTQAAYAAPLILLAQNRQDDRDRVQAEQDRQSNERNHATTDFITREIASLRLALNEVATRDFVRGELRDLLEELGDEIAVDETGRSRDEDPH